MQTGRVISFWLSDFTSKMPHTKCREFQHKTIALAMESTPADSPQRQQPILRAFIQPKSQPPAFPSMFLSPPRPPQPQALSHGAQYVDISQPSHQYIQQYTQPYVLTVPQQMISELYLLSTNFNFVSLEYLQSSYLLCTFRST